MGYICFLRRRRGAVFKKKKSHGRHQYHIRANRGNRYKQSDQTLVREILLIGLLSQCEVDDRRNG